MSLCDYFDLVVLILITFGTIWGLFIGCVSVLSLFVATAAGLFVSRRFTAFFAQLLHFDAIWGRYIVAIVLFALASLVVYMLASMLNNLIQKHSLNAWNSVLGVVVGCILSIAMCWCLSWGISRLTEIRPLVTLSRSVKYFEALVHLNIPETKIPMPTSEPDGESSDSTNWTLPEDATPSKVHNFLDNVDAVMSHLLPDSKTD